MKGLMLERLGHATQNCNKAEDRLIHMTALLSC